MPSFVAKGPLVPDELVQDLEDDRVVLFCGAGISMGAGLPDYVGLVRQVYEELGVALPSKQDRRWIWPDRMLGELEARSHPGAVRAIVMAALSKKPRDLAIHEALLRLARLNRHDGLRLVTTNFDTFFEEADPKLRPGMDLHSGPILPIPRDDRAASWRSVVYLHGRLQPAPDTNEHLIMTSADFGRAYLTDGWAARFVARLFMDFSVLFVGYSLNDPVLRYMTDAFAAETLSMRLRSSRPPAYIFVPYKGAYPHADNANTWRHRGLEPIFYHQGRHHHLLKDTLIAWAAARDDWLSSASALVGRVAPAKPETLDPGDVSNLTWTLFGRAKDGFAARVFAELSPAPPIEWLQAVQRHEAELEKQFNEHREAASRVGQAPPPFPTLHLKYLAVAEHQNNLQLSPAAVQIARWMIRHLPEEGLIDWVTAQAKFRRRLHPMLRSMIRQHLADETLALSTYHRRFWRIVSSEGDWTGRAEHTEHAWEFQKLLAEEAGRELANLEILALLRPYLRLSPSIWRTAWAGITDAAGQDSVDLLEERMSLLAEFEVEIAAGIHLPMISKALDDGAGNDEHLIALADDFTSLLKRALDLWAIVGEANSDSDPSQFQRPSIRPHPQNPSQQDWTSLIGIVWKSWSVTDSRSCERSRRLVERWRTIPYPTFSRLALQAIGESRCWTPAEKMDVLLNGI